MGASSCRCAPCRGAEASIEITAKDEKESGDGFGDLCQEHEERPIFSKTSDPDIAACQASEVSTDASSAKRPLKTGSGLVAASGQVNQADPADQDNQREQKFDKDARTPAQKNRQASLEFHITDGPDADSTAALQEAAECMEEYNVLDAERVLTDAILNLRQQTGESADKESRRIQNHPIYKEIAKRCEQYDRAGKRVLEFDSTDADFQLVWVRPDAKLWLNNPPGATVIDIKVAINIDAPLRQCMVPANEMDLQPTWNKLLCQAPAAIGRRRRFKMVTHSLLSILMFRLELIFEVFRVCNTKFGFLVECIRSEFPSEGLTMPEKSWRNTRIGVDTSNIWMPRGGGSDGTLLIQVSRIDLGIQVPEKMVKKILEKAAGGLVDNLITSATRAKEPGSIWQKRLAEDRDGLYAELQRVEDAAAKRNEVSVDSLPGAEIFERGEVCSRPKERRQTA